MATDSRLIPAQAYGRYNRVVAYNELITRGLYCLPSTEDARFGWGEPFFNPNTGQLINPPLGTPLTSASFVNTKRAFVRINRGPSNAFGVVRGQTFSNIGEVDWQGPQLADGTQECLTFRHTRARYFPDSSHANFGSRGNQILNFPPNNFPDNAARDTVFFRELVSIDGPGGLVAGVAIRNLDTDDPEYVCIVGSIVDGWEFFVAPFQLGETSPAWSSIGTIPVQAPWTSVSQGTHNWYDVPFLFSRQADKCVQTVMSTFPAATNWYRFDVEVLESSISFDLVGPIQSERLTTFDNTNDTDVSVEQTPDPTSAPDCPDRIDVTTETTSTVTQSFESVEEQSIACAHDFDDDGNLISLVMSAEAFSLRTYNSVGVRTIVQPVCILTSGPMSGEPDFGAATSAEDVFDYDASFEAQTTYTFTINGGPGDGTVVSFPNIQDINESGFSHEERTLSTVSFACVSLDVQTGSMTGSNKAFGGTVGSLQIPHCDLRSGFIAVSMCAVKQVNPIQIGPTPDWLYQQSRFEGPCFGEGPGPVTSVQGTELGIVPFNIDLGPDCPDVFNPCVPLLKLVYDHRLMDWEVKIRGPNGISEDFQRDSGPQGETYIFFTLGQTVRTIGGSALRQVVPVFGGPATGAGSTTDSGVGNLIGLSPSTVPRIDATWEGHLVRDRFGGMFYSSRFHNCGVEMQGWTAVPFTIPLRVNPAIFTLPLGASPFEGVDANPTDRDGLVSFAYPFADIVNLTAVTGDNPMFHQQSAVGPNITMGIV